MRLTRIKRKSRISQQAKTQALRIIGGEHRGRRLQFKSAEGLRPTSDRVRETLFNWLQPVISGARCLDMFAGSGLLGMEAASRGAAEVVFIEQHRATADQLRENVGKLGLSNTQLINADAFDSLADLQPFDMVFVDPPFHAGLLLRACEQLQSHHLLKPASRVYLESELAVEADELPPGWELIRSKQAGQVFYHLAIIQKDNPL